MGTTPLGPTAPQNDPHAEQLEAIADRTAAKFPSLSAKLRQIARDARTPAAGASPAVRALDGSCRR
jgi:hypothetical protein